MIEKNYDITGKIDTPLKKIAKIVFKETNGFISENMSEADIVKYFKDNLKLQDFVSLAFKVAGCSVAYNVVKMRNQLTLSSAFDLPRSGHKIEVGPFEVKLKLESSYVCLDTSKATDVIQFYLGLEGFASKCQSTLNEDTVKTSELFKFFEDLGYTMDGDKQWAKAVKNSVGKMTAQVTYNGGLDAPIYRYHMDMISVVMAMIEAE